MAMTNFVAAMIVEGQWDLAGIEDEDVTEELYVEAAQHLINTGAAWTLQGFFGRTCLRLIEDGLCTQAEGAH